MSKRAVLIGINYEGSPIDAPLNGCVNDVIGLRDILINKYGFPEENLRVLIDSNNNGEPMPTGQNIMDALKAAIEESQDGDILVIHYSGHGSQQQDTSGEETDGKDEFLVAYDGVPVTDDVLKGLLAQLNPGVRLTMIADCCHSGTMLDQPAQDIEVAGEKSAQEDELGALPEGAANRSLPTEAFHNFVQSNYSNPADFFRALPGVPDEIGAGLDAESTTSRDWMSSAFDFLKQQAEQAAAAQLQQAGGGYAEGEEQPDLSEQVPAAPQTINLEHCVLISGCEDNQTSADATLDGQPNGALTWGLVTVLKEVEGNITYRDLIHDVRGKLAESNFAQNPTLNCGDGVADTPFICEI